MEEKSWLDNFGCLSIPIGAVLYVVVIWALIRASIWLLGLFS